MAEAVKVIVRCRPMNQREKDLKCEAVVEMVSNIGQCQLKKPKDRSQPPKIFTFDGAYYMDSTTETIYNDICFPLVEGVLEGYNGTVFAYGQTGCGKSFSMMGITDPPTQRGIIPRAFEHIFETIQVSENSKFLVHASYLEIYNEEIRDLLGKDHKTKLDLKEHPERGVYVKDLSRLPVNNVSECEKVMDLGGKNRSVGSTLMNADSSRSHSIFTINLEILDTGTGGGEHIRAGKLNLVDLAGSERQAKTGATGDRLKEATKINLSLSALGNVISALVDGKSKHIPYRDSKLTRLLQDSLGGNTKTLMVACLSPADNNYDETLSTLRYANRAKNIKNKPHINEDPKDALLRQYQDEIESLKKMLLGQMKIPAELLAGGRAAVSVEPEPVAPQPTHEDYIEMVAKETEQVKQDYEAKLAEMKMMFEAEQMSKQKLQEEMVGLKDEYNTKVRAIEEHYQAEEKTVAAQDQGLVSITPSDDITKNSNDNEALRRMSSINGELDSSSASILSLGPSMPPATEDLSLIQLAQQAAVQDFNMKTATQQEMQGQVIDQTTQDVQKLTPETLTPVSEQSAQATSEAVAIEDVQKSQHTALKEVHDVKLKVSPPKGMQSELPDQPIDSTHIARDAAPKNAAKDAATGEASRSAATKETIKKLTPKEAVKDTATKEAAKDASIKEDIKGVGYSDITKEVATKEITRGMDTKEATRGMDTKEATRGEDSTEALGSTGTKEERRVMDTKEAARDATSKVGALDTANKKGLSHVQNSQEAALKEVQASSLKSSSHGFASDKVASGSQIVQQGAQKRLVATEQRTQNRKEDAVKEEPFITKTQATDLESKASSNKGVQNQVSVQAADVTQEVQQQALRRLAALQEKMVGGERKNDQKLKEKRKERKAYALSKRQKLLRAIDKMEDDGIMIKVYDNMQDEIRAKNVKVEQLDTALKSANNEIDDIQSEFERDRSDYLDTIRKQEQMIKLQQQILDKIQPCIRRDCNYYNLDKVKVESIWDDLAGKWNIPELILTKTTLPSPGIMPGGNARPGGGKSPMNRAQINNQGQVVNGYPGYHDEQEEDKFLSHLSKSLNAEYAASYFKPKRAEKLLAQTSKYERTSPPAISSSKSSSLHSVNGHNSSFATSSYLGGPPTSSGEHQGIQHQQSGRPVRLESLNVTNEKVSRKKKKNKQINLEYFGS